MRPLIRGIHKKLVFDRRTEVLSQHLGKALPRTAKSVLDVGCGDGLIDRLLMNRKPGLQITGIDVLMRPDPHIEVVPFDGTLLPFENGSFDYVMFVDVLHHTADPKQLLSEAARVARHGVIIKDHRCKGAWDKLVLRFMDWVGDAPHGVALPYRYFSLPQWQSVFLSAGLKVSSCAEHLGIYPFPASAVFDRKLHFVAKLKHRSKPSSPDGDSSDTDDA